MCGKSSSPPVPNSTSTAFQSATSPSSFVMPFYEQYLNQAQDLAGTPFNAATLGTAAPLDPLQIAAGADLYNVGTFIPQAASGFGNYAYGLAADIPTMTLPAMQTANQDASQVFNLAMNAGQQAQPIYNLGMGAAQATQPIQALGMSEMARAAPIVQAAMQAGTWDPNQVQAIMSPYIQDVVNATQNQFNSQNAIQGSSLLSQGIRAGNAFGGDRSGIAEAQLANQQQLAQAPVIAGLYQSGYGQALDEFNKLRQLGLSGDQLALAAQQLGLSGGQLALSGIQTGLQGGQLGLGALGLGLQGGQLGLSAAGVPLQA